MGAFHWDFANAPQLVSGSDSTWDLEGRSSGSSFGKGGGKFGPKPKNSSETKL